MAFFSYTPPPQKKMHFIEVTNSVLALLFFLAQNRIEFATKVMRNFNIYGAISLIFSPQTHFELLIIFSICYAQERGKMFRCGVIAAWEEGVKQKQDDFLAIYCACTI